jgi:hypothetical protein
MVEMNAVTEIDHARKPQLIQRGTTLEAPGRSRARKLSITLQRASPVAEGFDLGSPE